MTRSYAEGVTETVESPVCYVYGILSADTCLPAPLTGTGGGRVSMIRYRGLAGAVSELPPLGALGSREDLACHERVVASLAEQATILPLRFGAVVTTSEAVVKEMLEPYYDWFAQVLGDLRGRAEFSVSGNYVQETVLREVLSEEPEVLQLRESLREVPDDAGYYDRVRLGELIVHALDAKREADTEDLVQSLARYAVEVAPRPPIGEETAVEAAFLVADEDQACFEQAVDELGYRWAGRVRLRMSGPLAPYDFVPPPPEEM